MSASLLCFRPTSNYKQQSPRAKGSQQRIDRSMIGLPTNFVHTAHLGSHDLSTDHQRLMEVQQRMQSKGGYSEGNSSPSASSTEAQNAGNASLSA